jgi:DNA-binding SARP family transcriptional activator
MLVECCVYDAIETEIPAGGNIVHVQLLGPLRVGCAGQYFRLSGRRSQVIMALLALEANRVVPVDRLIDAVWEDAPPSTARGQVQICVSALRRTFTGRSLASPFETHHSGYLLRVADGQLDADVFGRLIAEARSTAALGDVAAAAERMRAALALWNGPALAGLPGRVIDAGRKRLEELRTAAIEERIRLDLALGHHEDVIGELIWLIERDRLRERLYALLMLALYRAGRQAEALDVYHAARTAFVDTLGIEPGDELRRLEQGILLGDPELELSTHRGTARRAYRPAAPRPAPHQLPSDTADFVGRDDELTAACDALAQGRAEGRAVPVVCVTGRAGIGKSALALHVAHRALPSYPDGQLYASFDAMAGRTERVLRRFLRALGVDRDDIPAETDEQAHLYRSRLAGQRILILLDGVTDETQVQPLLPGSGSCGVLVTSRSALVGPPRRAPHPTSAAQPGRRATPTRQDRRPAARRHRPGRRSRARRPLWWVAPRATDRRGPSGGARALGDRSAPGADARRHADARRTEARPAQCAGGLGR